MHSELITRVKLSNVSIVSYGYLCLCMHMLSWIVRSVNIFSLYKPQVYTIQWFSCYFLWCIIIHNNEDVETIKILLCAHVHTHTHTQSYTNVCVHVETRYRPLVSFFRSCPGGPLAGRYLYLGQSRRALSILLAYLSGAGTMRTVLTPCIPQGCWEWNSDLCVFKVSTLLTGKSFP